MITPVKIYELNNISCIVSNFNVSFIVLLRFEKPDAWKLQLSPIITPYGILFNSFQETIEKCFVNFLLKPIVLPIKVTVIKSGIFNVSPFKSMTRHLLSNHSTSLSFYKVCIYKHGTLNMQVYNQLWTHLHSLNLISNE